MDEHQAQILLHRRVSPMQPALLYTVEVDEQPVTRLAVSQRYALEVTPGRHKIQAKVLWMSSPALAVDVAAGQSLHVDVKPDVRHVWNMALRPKHFLRIDAVHPE
jgi:hypothetical protein